MIFGCCCCVIINDSQHSDNSMNPLLMLWLYVAQHMASNLFINSPYHKMFANVYVCYLKPYSFNVFFLSLCILLAVFSINNHEYVVGWNWHNFSSLDKSGQRRYDTLWRDRPHLIILAFQLSISFFLPPSLSTPRV